MVSPSSTFFGGLLICTFRGACLDLFVATYYMMLSLVINVTRVFLGGPGDIAVELTSSHVRMVGGARDYSSHMAFVRRS